MLINEKQLDLNESISKTSYEVEKLLFITI